MCDRLMAVTSIDLNWPVLRCRSTRKIRCATTNCVVLYRLLAALPAENRASALSASQSSYTAVGSVVMLFVVTIFIVRCVGGSKGPPVLHSSYRTDFERDCAV